MTLPELAATPRRIDVRAPWVAWLGGRPPTTVRARLSDLRALGAFLGRPDLEPEDLAEVLAGEIPSRVRAIVAAWTTAQASSGLRGTTIARRISTVASLLAELAAHGFGSLPVLSRPTVAAYQKQQCPPHSRVELSIATLERDGRRLEHAALLLVADTGLRCSEACSLDAVDLHHGPPPAVTVVRKGGRRVTRTISKRAHVALVAVLDGRTSGPLLATPRGRRFSASSLRRLTRALELGTPHRLRDSGATHLYHTTHDAELVRQWLDHRNLSTTQIYVVGLDDTAGEATRVLAGE